jgi:hypothetical protein
VYPSLSRRSTTPFQLEESAHAPWTRRIVGLVCCSIGWASALTIPTYVNPNMITAIRSLCFFMDLSPRVIESLLAEGA